MSKIKYKEGFAGFLEDVAAMGAGIFVVLAVALPISWYLLFH
jgi:hypothetical protein